MYQMRVILYHSHFQQSTKHGNACEEINSEFPCERCQPRAALDASGPAVFQPLAGTDSTPLGSYGLCRRGQEFLDCLEGKTEVETEPKDTGSLEECKYCHRKFRFDRIAKHETRCPESKPKPAKLDVVRMLLQGTPGEQNIPAARQDFLSGKKLPPLPVKPTEPFSSTDVTTCRYSQHSRRTTPRHAASMPRESTPRHTPSTPREGTTPRQQSRGHRGGGGVAEASGRASRSRESRESKTEEVSALGRAAKGDRLARASRSLIKGVAQPSYDQLEVDVSNWLDD